MFRRNRSAHLSRTVLSKSIAPCVEALEGRRLFSVPNGPFAMSATAASSTSVNLAFYDSASDETGFVIQKSTSLNGAYATVTTLPAAPGTSTQVKFTDTSDSPSTTYYYRAYAINASGQSGMTSASVTTPAGSGGPVTVPTAPSNLAAVVSGTSVLISFSDNSTNESDFVLSRSTSATGTYSTIATITGDNTTGAKTYTDSAVATGTTYYYKLYAENSAGPTALIGPVSVTTPAGGGTTNPGGTPNGPFGLSATAVSAGSVNLAFYDSATNETGFVVSRSTSLNGTYTTLATLPAAAGTSSTVAYTDTTTTGSTTYYYKVYAINGPYSSSTTSASVTTPAGSGAPVTAPNAPSAFSAAVVGSNVLISFVDNSTNEVDFALLRSTSATGTYTKIATIAGDAATGAKNYTDSSVAASTTYYYKVYAENSAGPSTTVGPVSVTTPTPTPVTIPAAPTGLSASLSGTSVVLSFADNSTNESDFVLQRSTSSTGSFVTVATITGDAVTGTKAYTDASVATGTTYYYKVYAENSAGASALAGPATVTTPVGTGTPNPGGPPNGPFGFTATANNANSVGLAFYDSATNETGFAVTRSTSLNGTYATIATLPPAAGSFTTVAYTDTTTFASTTYYYKVYAINGPYSSSVASASVTTPAGGTPITIPVAPTGLTAALAGSSVLLTFTDNSTTETDFVLQRSTSAAGTYATVATIPGDATTGTKTYTDAAVTAGVTYYYKVYAENTAGPSTVAGPVNVTTPSAPLAPSVLSATVSGANVVVSFTDNSTNEADFVLQRSTSATGTYTTVATITGDTATGTKAYTDGTVAAGTTYYYKVYAENAVGPSATVGPVSVTTAVVLPQTPAAPTNVFANASGANVWVSFNDNSTNESDFVLQRSTSATGTFSTVATIAGDATTELRSYLDQTVATGTTYFYRLYADNAAGPSALSTPVSVTSSPGLPTTANAGGPPSGPYGTTASALTANAVQVTFVDSASNETGFVILRSTSASGTYSQVGTLPASTVTRGKLSFVDVGVQPGTAYYYEVYAVNGPSQGSNFDGPVGVTTPAASTGNTPTGQWVPYANLISQSNEVADFPTVNGTGVTVAVIDRGIDYNAPGLSPSKIAYGYNFRDNNTVTLDDYGHGTGVAGIIAADGYTYNGLYNQGVAPGAKIVSLKQESSNDIKAALDWVIANAKAYNIQVINLTDFITDVEAGASDPTVYASELQTIWNMGIFISTPVGNGEVAYGNLPILYPAASPYVVGVGGVTQDGTFYADSLRGAGLDLVAPAYNVTMPFYTRNANSTGYDAEDDNYDGVGSIVDYAAGTSWASAYVSGTATLIKGVNSAITPDEILTILKQTGTPVLDPTNNVYVPMINVDKAVALAEQLYGPNGTSKP